MDDYYSSQPAQEVLPPQNGNQQEQIPPPVKPRSSGMATASLVMGILSIVFTCCCCGGFIFGSLAILFALLSRVDQRFEGHAKAGLITGCVGIALTVILFFLLMVIGVMSEGSSSPFLPDFNTLFIISRGGLL